MAQDRPKHEEPFSSGITAYDATHAIVSVVIWSKDYQQKATENAFNHIPYLKMWLLTHMDTSEERQIAKDILVLRVFDILRGCITAGNAYKPTPAMLAANLKVSAENPDEMRAEFSKTTESITLLNNWAKSLRPQDIEQALKGVEAAKKHDKKISETHVTSLRDAQVLETIREKTAQIDEILARPEPTVVQKIKLDGTRIQTIEVHRESRGKGRSSHAGHIFEALEAKERAQDEREDTKGKH